MHQTILFDPKLEKIKQKTAIKDNIETTWEILIWMVQQPRSILFTLNLLNTKNYPFCFPSTLLLIHSPFFPLFFLFLIQGFTVQPGYTLICEPLASNSYGLELQVSAYVLCSLKVYMSLVCGDTHTCTHIHTKIYIYTYNISLSINCCVQNKQKPYIYTHILSIQIQIDLQRDKANIV